jgi:transposase
VKRGFSRRKAEPVARLGVDEKSFTRGHHYFTMVDDLDRSQVLFVGEHRTTETLDEFWSALTAEQIDAVQAVAMDMWDPYVNSTLNHLPDARNKIVFDKFHIAKHLSEAVDLVRRREHKQLKARGDDRLAGTRYDWLRHPGKMDPADRREFAALRDSNLKTAKAWALKEGVTNHRLKAVALVTGCKPCSGQRPAKCPRSYSGRRCTSR